MTREQLDSAMENMAILAEMVICSPLINIGGRHYLDLGQTNMSKRQSISQEVKELILTSPELQARLKLRYLEMEINQAKKELEKITGENNGK